MHIELRVEFINLYVKILKVTCLINSHAQLIFLHVML